MVSGKKREVRPRGRPALPPQEVKRHAIGFRTTKDLRDRLQTESEASGRSVAQEVEIRLQKSFDERQTLNAHMADVLGGARLAALFRLFAGLAGGETWLTDRKQYNSVTALWRTLLTQIAPPGPGAKHEEIERHKGLLKRLLESEAAPSARDGAELLVNLAKIAAQDKAFDATTRADVAALGEFADDLFPSPSKE